MDQHVTFHPIDDELLHMYLQSTTADGHGCDALAGHCAAHGLSAEQQQQLLGLLPHFGQRTDLPFDQSHGFGIALAQGFFDKYFYLNASSLSSVSEVIAPYTQPWQATLPGWAATASAHNHGLGQFSSGVYIPPAMVAQLMNDAHTNPELGTALAVEFPDGKFHMLWAALQHALDRNAGLLEAFGAIEPNVADIAASQCFTLLDNCDRATLQLFVETAAQAVVAEPEVAGYVEAAPVAPVGEQVVYTPAEAAEDLPVPAHHATAQTEAPVPGQRLAGTPSLAERLRAKRDDIPGAYAV